jgi:probable metal-binding protein
MTMPALDHGHDHSREGDDFVPGHDVLGILADRGGRLTVAELKSAASAAFGEQAVYGNCHGDRFDFEGLLAFLSAAGKLSLDGDHAALGHNPGCSGH